MENLKKILYGTTNPAKLQSMKTITDPMGIELIGLHDFNKPLPHIDESGRDPLENARIKAETYYKEFAMPVFSCDSGLYFDELDDSLQPGTHIRRVNGKWLNDDEMIRYYASLAKKHNNCLTGRYKNAIYLIINDTTIIFSMDESLMTAPFRLVGVPHIKRIEGFPLDSLSVDIHSGRYYYDLEKETVETEMEQGFKVFFEKALSAIMSAP